MSDFESKYADFKGRITRCGVHEYGVGATTPFDTVVRADQPCHIHVEWEVSGIAVPVTVGTWHVDSYFESIGPGAEMNVYGPHHLMSLVPGQTKYATTIEIPAGRVPVEPNHSTPYKVVVTVVFQTPAGIPGPMAGFVELPVLQFYNATP